MFRTLTIGAVVGAFVLGLCAADAGAQDKKKRKKGDRTARLKKLFEQMDADNNGKLTKKEYKAGMEKVIKRIADKRGEKFAKRFQKFFEARLKRFAQLDADNDGLTFDEFKKLNTRRRKKKKDAAQQ